MKKCLYMFSAGTTVAGHNYSTQARADGICRYGNLFKESWNADVNALQKGSET